MSQAAGAALPPRVHLLLLVDAPRVVRAARDLQDHFPLQLHHAVRRVLLAEVAQAQLAERAVAPCKHIAAGSERRRVLIAAREVDHVLALEHSDLDGHRLQLVVAVAQLPVAAVAP